MKVLVTGATGLVGTALLAKLRNDGHETVSLTRRPRADTDIGWNPASNELDASAVDGFDTVIHLAGESIAEGRWNAAKKQRIRQSRVDGTQLLANALAGATAKPKLFISASAIGYYGDRGDELLDEESSLGGMYLSEVCEAWEQATAHAEDAGIRVVHARFGVILSPLGGALAKMLLPFKLGGGGILGSGKQYMSWITLPDVIAALGHICSQESLTQAVNLVAPNPVTNREFTKTLGRVLSRPTIMPMPAFAARLAFGEMADELLLASARVSPKKLEQSGYAFEHPDLETGLRAVLSK